MGPKLTREAQTLHLADEGILMSTSVPDIAHSIDWMWPNLELGETYWSCEDGLDDRPERIEGEPS